MNECVWCASAPARTANKARPPHRGSTCALPHPATHTPPPPRPCKPSLEHTCIPPHTRPSHTCPLQASEAEANNTRMGKMRKQYLDHMKAKEEANKKLTAQLAEKVRMPCTCVCMHAGEGSV